MQILEENDTSRSRTQSGIAEEGPLAVIIGAGSLGSALLNLWGRSGWGKWTVIDNDHIKPHNLLRHTAGAPHIGRLKVEAVAHLHALATCGASEIKPLYADATDFANATVTESLTKAQLVIDASTSLAYPRAASRVDAFARHISVFITPDGNAGVLLAEDSKRSISLRTLEAQYYRTLIQQDVGKVHLTSNTSSFRSGSSCRDISLVLPYSKILIQASTLAEQIPHAFASENASIRIWQRDPSLGVVEVHDVPTATERSMKLGGYDLYIDAGAEQLLRSLRSNALPNETGGVLLGYHDFNINAIIVVSGLPSPSDSKANHLSFERGENGVEEAIKKASQRTAGNVVYIGEWHSHPKGHSAAPSNQDAIQLTYLAKHMAEEGLPAVQLIVGEDDIQVFIGKPSE
jgi:integrative and conjugative element protein (TIGR02256 family)